MACIIKVPYTVGPFASLLPPPPLNMFTAGGDSLREELIFLLPIVKLLWLSMWPHRQHRHYFYWMRPPAEWMIPAYKPWIIERREISQREGRKRHEVLMAWWARWRLLKEQRDGRLISQSVILLHHCLQASLLFSLSLSLSLALSPLIGCFTHHSCFTFCSIVISCL